AEIVHHRSPLLSPPTSLLPPPPTPATKPTINFTYCHCRPKPRSPPSTLSTIKTVYRLKPPATKPHNHEVVTINAGAAKPSSGSKRLSEPRSRL
ncbi:hypothetical protein Dimus_008641, partial [Dionaea muscipula]